MIKIAVITPVFNSEKFIADNIKSVSLLVHDKNFTVEHVVIDDGSADNSWKIIRAAESPLLKAYRLDKNSGASAARNYGIGQTDANFLFCLDADDVIFQNSLKSLFDFSQKANSVWVYGDFLKGDEKLSYLPGRDYYGHQFENPAELLTSMFSGEHFFQQSGFYSKQLFNTAGGFDPGLRVCEDLDLFVRFALAGNIPRYFPSPLYLHRFHGLNLSKTTGRENNPAAHKQDLNLLYGKYEKLLMAKLSLSQVQKIRSFLKESI